MPLNIGEEGQLRTLHCCGAAGTLADWYPRRLTRDLETPVQRSSVSALG